MTGPKAVLQASQNDESFTDSIEDLIDEYLELIFPSEDTSETMQLIELMTSRDPDSKIRAIVATEGQNDFWMSSFEPKNEQNISVFSTLTSKMVQIIKIMAHYHAN